MSLVANEPDQRRVQARERPLSSALAELYAEHEVLAWDEESGAVIVRPRTTRHEFADDPDIPRTELLKEYGTTGNSRYWGDREEEYHPQLRGMQGLKVYDQMRRSDAQVSKSLILAKTPVLAGRWFIEPASASPEDKEIADFVWRCFTEYSAQPFEQLLWEALTMLEFGYSIFEKVMERRVIDGKPRWIWHKFAHRSPIDVEEWHWDNNGSPLGVTFLHTHSDGNQRRVKLAIEKLLIFTHRKEFGNLSGISLLRSVYRHWWYKDNLTKIDAIQKERHATGIPIIKLPPGYDDLTTPGKSDIALAKQIGRNLRVNEKAYVILPPQWEIEFARLDTQPVHVVPSIEFHNREIADNILAAWSAGGGSDNETMMDMFLRASRYHALTVAATINAYAIPALVRLNFGAKPRMPTMHVRRIGEDKIDREQSFTLRNLVGADLIRADAGMEAYLRDQMQLPEYDEATDRKLEAIQRQEEQAEKRAAEQAANAEAMAKAQSAPGAKPGEANQGRAGQAGAPRQTPAERKTGAGTKKVGGDTGNVRTK